MAMGKSRATWSWVQEAAQLQVPSPEEMAWWCLGMTHAFHRTSSKSSSFECWRLFHRRYSRKSKYVSIICFPEQKREKPRGSGLTRCQKGHT